MKFFTKYLLAVVSVFFCAFLITGCAEFLEDYNVGVPMEGPSAANY